MFLPREKEYMQKEFGFNAAALVELVYIVGLISANNMMMVHLISEGIEIDDMLKPFVLSRTQPMASKFTQSFLRVRSCQLRF